MYLVAIAWMYVVLMMSIAEATSPQGTVLGALFTFLLYGALPLSIVMYVMGTPGRRRARLASQRSEADAEPDETGHQAAAQNTQNDGSTTATSVGAPAGSPSSLDPDGGGHAAGDAVAPVRKEP